MKKVYITVDMLNSGLFSMSEGVHYLAFVHIIRMAPIEWALLIISLGLTKCVYFLIESGLLKVRSTKIVKSLRRANLLILSFLCLGIPTFYVNPETITIVTWLQIFIPVTLAIACNEYFLHIMAEIVRQKGRGKPK